jgi:hypothetical protein
MQRSDGARLVEARFGWSHERLYVLLVPRDRADLEGLEIESTVTPVSPGDESVFHFAVAEGGKVEATCSKPGLLTGSAEGAWRDVVEISLPLSASALAGDGHLALTLRVGKNGMVDQVFRSAGLAPVGGI